MTSSNAPQRQPRFQRNPELEQLLNELNDRLPAAERDLAERFSKPKHPVLLVIGAPRSGTTLMMQWLAHTGLVAYPSNMLSRFYAAPYIGALICRLIGDPKFDFGGELFDHDRPTTEFSSELGKTKGMFEPNEFWYFWRRFIPNDQAVRLSESELSKIDARGFLAGLAALQAVFDQPWAMKGIILQYNLAFLQSIFEKFLFIRTRRELVDNARSLLKAREQYFGDAREWYSVRPPGYQQLLTLSPIEQVTGQVRLTNDSIDDEFRRIPQHHQLDVDYASFCANPRQCYDQIVAKLDRLGYAQYPPYHGPERFPLRTHPPGPKVVT